MKRRGRKARLMKGRERKRAQEEGRTERDGETDGEINAAPSEAARLRPCERSQLDEQPLSGRDYSSSPWKVCHFLLGFKQGGSR